MTTVSSTSSTVIRRPDRTRGQIGEDFAPQLTVKLSGDAGGTVTSSPAGINCGYDCTESYASGTGVTLTATPPRAGPFAGWGGACTGTNKTAR